MNSEGSGVPGAAIRVRYHEPEKPLRRVAFDAEEETDDDGEFIIPNLGVDVPFVVDVNARDYVATSSEQYKITSDTNALPKSTVLSEKGGTVVAQLRDKQGNPLPGVQVIIMADPSGRPSGSRGSWLHAKSLHQIGSTSSLGNIRLSGVSTGNILVRAKFNEGVVEQRATIKTRKRLDWVTLDLLAFRPDS